MFMVTAQPPSKPNIQNVSLWIRTRLSIPIMGLILVLSSYETWAQAQVFAQVPIPVGVATDADGSVFVTHDGTPPVLSKFDPGANFLGASALGTFQGRIAPLSNGNMLHLDFNGTLSVFDPAGNRQDLLNFKQANFPVDISSVYDMATGRFSNLGGIVLPQAPGTVYGDIAVLETSNSIELYVTGASVQTFFFVMQVTIQGNSASGKVVVSTSATTAPENTQPRGVAVNDNGIVLTTLPVVPTGSVAGFDVLVAFQHGFGSNNPPQYIDDTDVTSLGMTTDSDGNFYIATGSVGTSLAGTLGSGAVVVVSADLRQYLGVFPFAPDTFTLMSSEDVAVSPRGDRMYVTFSNRAIVATQAIDFPPPVQFPNLTFDPEETLISVNGSEIEVTVRALNTGPGDAPRVVVDFFLLPFDGDPNKVAFLGQESRGRLNSGNGANLFFSTDLNSLNLSLPQGEYFLAFSLDNSNEIQETNEEDNIGDFSNIPIQWPISQVLPNLTFVGDQSSLQINNNQINANVRVINNGDEEANNAQVIFVLIPNVPNPDNLFPIGLVEGINLGPGRSTNAQLSVDVSTLGLDLTDPEYLVGFIIDPNGEIEEENEEDNVATFNSPIYQPTVSEGLPNLTFVGDQSSLRINNDQIDVSVRVVNDGDGEANNAQVIFVLLPNVPNPDNLFPIGLVEGISLGPGRSTDAELSVDVSTLGLNLTDEEYLVSFVIDPDREIEEENEEDNVATFNSPLYIPEEDSDSELPNLTLVSNQSSVEVDGNIITYSLRIANEGTVESSPFAISYFLEKSQTLSLTKFRISRETISNVLPGQTVDVIHRVDLDTVRGVAIPEDIYITGVELDPSGSIQESRENDNVERWIQVEIEVGNASSITSTKERLTETITIYPNPTSGDISLLAESPFTQEDKIRLIDLQGREVFSHAFAFTAGTKVSLQLPSLVNGVYGLLIEKNAKVKMTQIIISN